MQTNYMSKTTKWSSNTDGSQAYGYTNTVKIENGKGYKLKETLNAKGNVLNRTRRNLNRKEIQTILKGQFLPGLWQNCSRRNTKQRQQKQLD